MLELPESDSQAKPKYRLPFEAEVEAAVEAEVEEIEDGEDKSPTLEEMHRLVVLEKRRPSLVEVVHSSDHQWTVEMVSLLW